MTKLITGFFIVLILYSCSKEIDYPDSIVIGVQSGMFIRQIDTPLESTMMLATFDIDLDNDGNKDIQFRISHGALGAGDPYGSNVGCINSNTFIFGEWESDTAYEHINYDTIIQGNQTTFFKFYVYNCHKKYSSDTFSIRSPEYKLRFCDSGNTIMNSDTYRSTSVEMISEPYRGMYSCSQTGDSSYCSQTSWDYDCYLIPPTGIKYLAFMINKNNSIRLGWIRFSLDDYNKIKIYDVAIQRQ